MASEVIHMNSTVLTKNLMEVEPSMTKGNEVKVQRVLVVDDEKSISELITTSLRFVGFEVRTAATGAEALRVAKSSSHMRSFSMSCFLI